MKMRFHVYFVGVMSQWQFNKALADIAEYTVRLSEKYTVELDWNIHGYYQVQSSEELYNFIFTEAAKANDPYLIILLDRTWTRYGGALGWADCEGATATIHSLTWLPFYLSTWVIKHEMAHTVLCRQGKEWIKAVHNDPELN